LSVKTHKYWSTELHFIGHASNNFTDDLSFGFNENPFPANSG